MQTSYDRIAHLYDVDMARNMRFDDVALYASLAARAAGPVLEIGCGNGRILLALARAGVEAFGVDRSANMLAQLASRSAGIDHPPRVCRMDAQALGFRRAFELVLCPYSLVTYMTGGGDASAMLAGIARVLTPTGRVVLDAFIPRPATVTDGFREDYRRLHGDATLIRSKRVTQVAPERNRIERRYERVDVNGAVLELIETVEEIRPFAPDTLLRLLTACGFEPEQQWWDYAPGEATPDASYFTVLARLA